MKHILILLAAVTVSVTTLAAEKIEGAFGLRLGEAYEPSGNRFNPGDVTYADAFEFIPKNPNPAFSTYVVFITPNTHRIYRILAIAKLSDSAFGFEQSNTILALLHRKYGTGPFRGANAISQENRKVVVNNTSAGPPFTFHVDYTDQALTTQASEERLDNKLKGANADGL